MARTPRGETLAFDGKSPRRSWDKSVKKSARYLVSAQDCGPEPYIILDPRGGCSPQQRQGGSTGLQSIRDPQSITWRQ